MAVKTWLCEVRGLVPIVWNRLHKDLIDELKKIPKNKLDEWENEKSNWERRAELDEKGNVWIPSDWVKTALVIACKKTRMTPHFASKKNETYTFYVESCLFTVLKPIAKREDLLPYEAFVVIGDGRIFKIRPKLDAGWTVKIEMKDPYGRMTRDELVELLEFCGMFVGWGDARKKGMGRFEVLSVKEDKGG